MNLATNVPASAGSTRESPEQRLDRILRAQQEGFLGHPYPSAEERIALMKRVPDMLRGSRERILGALDADLGGCAHVEGDLFEIIGVIGRAKFNIAHVGGWMKPVSKPTDPVTHGNAKAYIKHQPKGVVGNMVTWNFPFDIGLGPTLDALAAGNRVVVKPSELTPQCGQVLAEMIADTFDEDEVAVVTGDLECRGTSRRCRGTTWCSPAAAPWAGRSCARPRPTWCRSPWNWAAGAPPSWAADKVTDRTRSPAWPGSRSSSMGRCASATTTAWCPAPRGIRSTGWWSTAGSTSRPTTRPVPAASSPTGTWTDCPPWWPTPGNVARR